MAPIKFADHLNAAEATERGEGKPLIVLEIDVDGDRNSVLRSFTSSLHATHACPLADVLSVTSTHVYVWFLVPVSFKVLTLLLLSSSSPLCRALAPTSWTTSCTSTGLCPSPSWQSVWSRCSLPTPAARGSLRWGQLCFDKTCSGTLQGPNLTPLHPSWEFTFMQQHFKQEQSQKLVLPQGGISFINSYFFLCLKCFSCFSAEILQKLLLSETDYRCSVLSLGSLISRVWSVCSGSLKHTWNRKSLNLCRCLLTLHESTL